MPGSLTADELYLVHLMSCALRGVQAVPLPEGASWEGVYHLALANSVTTTYALAVSQACGADEAQRKRWRDEVYKNGMRLALFADERQAIFAQMDKAGLAHLPVKGVVTSSLYPRPEMRWMCDNDFLFGRDLGAAAVRVADDEDAWALRRIMEARGYEVEEFGHSNHDAYEKLPFFNFEPHRLLADKDNKWRGYYADPWARARRSEGTQGLAYEFSREDHYVFHIAHMFKHFGRGGHGVRGIADEWALLQAWGASMDRGYIDAELGKLGMLEFEQGIREVCAAVIDGDACGVALRGNPDALAAQDAEVLTYMLESGTYGQREKALKRQIRVNTAEQGAVRARLGYVLRRLFPPLSALKPYYPVLQRAPWLLPLVHLYRFTVRPIMHRKQIGTELSALTAKDDDRDQIPIIEKKR